MTATRTIKERECRQCKGLFVPWSSLDVVCSAKCASDARVAKLERNRTTQRRKEQQGRRVQKAELLAKDRNHQLRLTQDAHNQWTRLRDRSQPCISCDETKGLMHAGHYRSVGAAPELRFCPVNTHKQCHECNTAKSGNVAAYRTRLIQRVGLSIVEWIEGPQYPANWTCEELMMVRSAYRRAIKRINR